MDNSFDNVGSSNSSTTGGGQQNNQSSSSSGAASNPHLPPQPQVPVSNRHNARSRTSSTGSLVGGVGGLNQAGQAGAEPHLFNRGVRCPSIEQLSASSRASSIPPTPAPTPNPLLQVTNHGHLHEQLVAGIQQLKGDEGIDVEGTSFPVTPAPSPFSPSPGAAAALHHIQPSPAQVAEGIQRLGGLYAGQRGGFGVNIPSAAGAAGPGILSRSGSSTGQPPTPSTTPGIQQGAFGFQGVGVGQLGGAGPLVGGGGLGIVPEHLAESIHRSLRVRDEGLDSTSSPGTPVPTPISPSGSLLSTSEGKILPEQIAAGIHRLKVEEGMSSGGSSGFPSTPAPTPFSQHPGGVRPEDLAAGISRLSVIEETDGMASNSGHPLQPGTSAAAQGGSSRGQHSAPPPLSHQSSLSQYFKSTNSSSELAISHPLQDNGMENHGSQAETFFDQLTSEEIKPKPPLPKENTTTTPKKNEEQSKKPSGEGDATSPTSPVVCTIFSEKKDSNDPFDSIAIGSARKSPSTLDIPNVPSGGSSDGSTPGDKFGTPAAPTPITQPSGVAPSVTPGFSTHPPPPTNTASPYLTNSVPQPTTVSSVSKPANYTGQQPITSPLQIMTPSNPGHILQQTPQIPPQPQDVGSMLEDDSDAERGEVGEASRMWIPCPATAEALANPGSADRSTLATPGVQIREDFLDPVRNLVSHYRGESEAAKRQVLNANSVSQDINGLCQLVRSGNFRAAVNLTSRLLNLFHQGVGKTGSVSKHTPLSLKIWYIRFGMLVKLKQFSMVEVEAEAFGDLDKPDLYHEFYSVTSGEPASQSSAPLTGSMVPFGMRLLLAELPQNLNRPHEAIDRLSRVLFVVRKIIKGQSDKESVAAQLWQRREVQVLNSIVNCAILQKDFEMAVSTLESIFDKAILSDAERVRVLSNVGRVYLQLGDVTAASSAFARAKDKAEKVVSDKQAVDGEVDQSELKLLTSMDDALLAVANGHFNEALTTLQALKETNPSASSDPSVINNTSVCLLYTGQLGQALSLLEGQLTSDPAGFLRETQVLNLATLYELESSYATQKKQSLLDFVARYAGDGANTSCLKF